MFLTCIDGFGLISLSTFRCPSKVYPSRWECSLVLLGRDSHYSFYSSLFLLLFESDGNLADLNTYYLPASGSFTLTWILFLISSCLITSSYPVLDLLLTFLFIISFLKSLLNCYGWVNLNSFAFSYIFFSTYLSRFKLSLNSPKSFKGVDYLFSTKS